MSFEFVRKLPTPHEVKEEFPVPEQIMEIKKKCDEEIKMLLQVSQINL